jgi:hypothetical protein
MNKDRYHHLLRSEFGHQTPPGQSVSENYFPGGLNFIDYLHLVSTIIHAGIVGRRGDLDDEKRAWFSHRIVLIVESVGGKVNISGLEALSHQPGPLVYIANQMIALKLITVLRQNPRDNLKVVIRERFHNSKIPPGRRPLWPLRLPACRAYSSERPEVAI